MQHSTLMRIGIAGWKWIVSLWWRICSGISRSTACILMTSRTSWAACISSGCLIWGTLQMLVSAFLEVLSSAWHRFCPRHPWRTFAEQVSRPAFGTSALWWMTALTTFPSASWVIFIPFKGLLLSFVRQQLNRVLMPVGDVRLVLAESRHPAA